MYHILRYLLFICLLSLFVMSIVYAQKPAPTHTVNGEYIKEWLVVGPFFPDELDTDFPADAGGEANIEPKEGLTVTTADGTPMMWKRYTSESNIINLLDAVGNHEYATAYAFCLLQSDIAGDVEILLGNDDEASVWVDGKQAHNNPGGWMVTPDQHRFEVDLKAGKTPCLVKVSQRNGPWGFAMRVLPVNRAIISGLITDEKRQPIPNADVRLEQDGQEMGQAKADASGSYRMSVYPVGGKYELAVTAGVRGVWKSDIPFRESDRQNLNFTLKEAISISGTLLMLDDA
ncbi:carboxypeptidase regulatory-like domain-containing protein, partial [bacterium]|nr:carboxypeptidase regulatory-like domain-containing protein [bacterium]